MTQRTVYFAKITRAAQQSLVNRGSFQDSMERAIDPENTVERFGRTWRFSKPIISKGVILGKLGFTHEGQERLTDYDEAAHDFITAMAPARQAFFSHFVIDVATEVIAFEDRGSLIRRQSFLGAFDGLLDAAGLDATIDPLTDPASLREWASSVDRVTRIHAHVVNPNPGWVEDSGAIRHLVEETDAQAVDVTAKASQGQGLNVGAPWVSGAVNQIGVEGQGTLTALGMRGQKESRWTSGQRVRSEQIEEEPEESSRTIWDRIAALLGVVRDG